MIDLVAEMAALVQSLIEDGYVTLHRQLWTSEKRDLAERGVLPTERAEVLSDPASWVWDDARSEFYVLVATAKGEEAFYDLIGERKSRPSNGDPLT